MNDSNQPEDVKIIDATDAERIVTTIRGKHRNGAGCGKPFQFTVTPFKFPFLNIYGEGQMYKPFPKSVEIVDEAPAAEAPVSNGGHWPIIPHFEEIEVDLTVEADALKYQNRDGGTISKLLAGWIGGLKSDTPDHLSNYAGDIVVREPTVYKHFKISKRRGTGKRVKSYFVARGREWIAKNVVPMHVIPDFTGAKENPFEVTFETVPRPKSDIES